MIYPIIDAVDNAGNQLINWMAEIKQNTFEKNDWNKKGNLAGTSIQSTRTGSSIGSM